MQKVFIWCTIWSSTVKVIITGTKEMKALQLMIQTYTETPDFGDSRNFHEELNIAVTKVENLSKDMNSLNRELDLVESKMNLNMRHSLLAAPSRSLVSLDNSTRSGGSDSIGYGSQSSTTDSDKVEDSLHDCEKEGESLHECDKVEDSLHGKGDVIEKAKEPEHVDDDDNKDKLDTEVNCRDTPCGPSKCSSMNIDDSSEDVYIQSERLSDESEEEFEDEHPQPCQACLVALYPYDGGEEGTLSMEAGEEFEVTSENIDGWIKVNRKNQSNEEGYIPFAFTQML